MNNMGLNRIRQYSGNLNCIPSMMLRCKNALLNSQQYGLCIENVNSPRCYIEVADLAIALGKENRMVEAIRNRTKASCELSHTQERNETMNVEIQMEGILDGGSIPPSSTNKRKGQ